MSSTGLNYFFQQVGVSNQLQIFYDFKQSGNNPIRSVSLGKSQYSGSISNANLFYKVSGSGFFNKNTLINIKNSSGLQSNDWTMGINYELSTGQNGILFSSFSSGAHISGFALGVNNNCCPYIEYYTNQGPSLIVSSNNWGTKNSLLLTKTSNSLTIDYLNFNSKTIESEQFSVNDNYFIFSDKWNLGGFSGAPSYFSGNNFSGYIDNFLFFTPSLLPYQKLAVFSGIYCDIFPPSLNITSGIQSVITGYSTGLIPIFSGNTGQANEFYTYLTGQCNSVSAQYRIIDLTGTVYDIGNTPLTKNITTYFTGVTGGNPIENSGYSKTFGMDGISYLKDIDSNDITEIFSFPNSLNKLNINNTLVFDRILNGYSLQNAISTDQINLYLDSVAQLGSGYNVVGDFYNQSVMISGMFYISGTYLSGSDYDSVDTNIVDYISGVRSNSTDNYFVINNTTGISGLALNNSSIFLNGIKLKSGIDYYNSGIDFILKNDLLYTITGGQYFTLPNDLESIYKSGIYNNTTINKSARNTSIIYLNGTREANNIDYQEISTFSTLNNKSNFLPTLQIIYNNSNNFIEKL